MVVFLKQHLVVGFQGQVLLLQQQLGIAQAQQQGDVARVLAQTLLKQVPGSLEPVLVHQNAAPVEIILQYGVVHLVVHDFLSFAQGVTQTVI